LRQLGSVGTLKYVDHLYNTHTDAQGNYYSLRYPVQSGGEGYPDDLVYAGFLQMLLDLEWIRDAWMRGVENPPALVFLCHSHGCVWTHVAIGLLSLDSNFLPVTILIDLDANAARWEDDGLSGIGDKWAAELTAYKASHWVDWWFDPSDVTDVVYVEPLQGPPFLLDIEDTVFRNVIVNIEYRGVSAGPIDTAVADDQSNMRPERGMDRERIATFLSDEDHSRMDDPDSATITHLRNLIFGM